MRAFDVSLQRDIMCSCILTVWAFIRLLISMGPHMCLQIFLMSAGVLALCTFPWLLTSMDPLMARQGTFSESLEITTSAAERFVCAWCRMDMLGMDSQRRHGAHLLVAHLADKLFLGMNSFLMIPQGGTTICFISTPFSSTRVGFSTRMLMQMVFECVLLIARVFTLITLISFGSTGFRSYSFLFLRLEQLRYFWLDRAIIVF